MAVLLVGSVGCVSLKHHCRKHSITGMIAAEKHSRYYHCPHCGQIIPKEGFYKCPRCFQVPVYHGYEPTCWRQWPAGWGCPPESVAGQPEFWSQGMVESDTVIETHSEPVPAEEVQLPQPANNDSSSVTPDPLEVASQEQAVSEPTSEAPAAPASEAVATEGTAQPEPKSIVESKPPAQTVTEPEEAALEVESPQPRFEPLAKQSRPHSGEAESSRMETEPVQPPTEVIGSGLARAERPSPADEVPSVKDAPLPVAEKKSAPAPVPAGTPTADAVAEVTPVPAAEPALVQQETEELEPQLEVVQRRPIPTRKVMLAKDDASLLDEVDDEGPSLPLEAVLLRAEPAVIDATQRTAPSALASVQPYDQNGPIPVRKVRLTEVEKESTESNAEVEQAVEEYPTPVNRIAVPSAMQVNPAGEQPGELQPAPVRRIQLSELPVRIQR